MKIRTKILAILCVLMLALCVPASSHPDEGAQAISGEISDVRDEIRNIAQNIHDESEHIADDESLPVDVRDVAEEVHLLAHDIDRSAHDVGQYLGDGEYDEAKAELATLKALIVQISGPAHDLEDMVPQSYEDHADQIHHDLHDLQKAFQSFEILFNEEVGNYEFADQVYTDEDDMDSNDKLRDIINDIRGLAQDIHDESEHIADDESLSDDVRDVAEEVHLLAHDIDRSADDMGHYIDDRKSEEAKAELSNLKALIVQISGPAHGLEDMVPQSHEHHADHIHHDLHDLQAAFQSFEILFNEWVDTNEAPVEAVEEYPVKSTPGFEMLFAVAGLLAVAFLTRRK
ncbi:MAG: PGF-CTERM sorting domain-containing protein [Methanolobus sp.]|nr:PGF-CTERM sorting domain-containing protein [Methanolobus sp.]